MLKLLLSLCFWLPALVGAADWAPTGATADLSPLSELHFMPRPQVHNPQRGNLRLRSVLTSGADAFAGTHFTVLREQPDAYGKTRQVVMATAGPEAFAEFSLNPGSYRVQARNGDVLVEQDIEIPASGILDADIILGAGELHLKGLLDEHGMPAEQAWFRVLRRDTDAYLKPTLVQVASKGYGDSASFVLPAGDYLAESRYGNATVQMPVSVGAGLASSYELRLNAGRLELFGTWTEGGDPAGDVRYVILRKAEAVDAMPVEIASADAATAVTFILPQGDYRVRAERDLAIVEQDVTVRAGETRSLELPLHAGELLVHATLAGRSDALLDSWFEIDPSSIPGGGAQSVPRGPDNLVRFVLPAGQHRVRVKHGESTGYADVQVEAGSRQSLAIDLDAGRVSISFIPGQQQPAFPYSWFSVYRIERDTRGNTRRHRVFNDGFYTSTDIVLPSGEYIAFARTDRHRGEQRFAVEPGAVESIAIVADRQGGLEKAMAR